MNISVPDGWYISDVESSVLEDLLPYQQINVIIGGIGTGINLILLLLLITSKYFIKNGKLTILLCIGDLCNSFYIFMQGYTRYNIYLVALNYKIIKEQTYWSCALYIFDWMGLLGSLIPHMVTLIIGIERIMAIKLPVIYKQYFSDGQIKVSIFCIVYVVISIIIAFALAYSNKNVKSKYWCGRKVSYTVYYTSFIYVMNVLGYVICFLLTFIVMLHVKMTLFKDLDKKNMKSQEKRQMRNYYRIRQIVIISLISSVTISFPSFVSLASSVLGGLNATIADPSDWVSVIKSSINLFVYMALNREFQNRLFGDIFRIHTFVSRQTNSFVITKIVPNAKTRRF